MMVYPYRYQYTKDVCSFIAYCVSDFKAVFPGLIFLAILVDTANSQIKISTKYKCFTVNTSKTVISSLTG